MKRPRQTHSTNVRFSPIRARGRVITQLSKLLLIGCSHIFPSFPRKKIFLIFSFVPNSALIPRSRVIRTHLEASTLRILPDLRGIISLASLQKVYSVLYASVFRIYFYLHTVCTMWHTRMCCLVSFGAANCDDFMRPIRWTQFSMSSYCLVISDPKWKFLKWFGGLDVKCYRNKVVSKFVSPCCLLLQLLIGRGRWEGISMSNAY